MSKTRNRNRIEVGVWRFLSDSEWSQNAFFDNLLESESIVSNFKIETKRMLVWNVILTSLHWFTKLWKVRSQSMILEKISESDWSQSWICRS